MKNSIKLLILTMFMTTLLNGCATIFSDSNYPIGVSGGNGEENVKVKVGTSEGESIAKLPATLITKGTNKEVYVQVIDKCYVNEKFVLDHKVTPSFWANILWTPVGMLIFGGLDYFTGNMWKYDIQKVVPLQKKDSC